MLKCAYVFQPHLLTFRVSRSPVIFRDLHYYTRQNRRTLAQQHLRTTAHTIRTHGHTRTFACLSLSLFLSLACPEREPTCTGDTPGSPRNAPPASDGAQPLKSKTRRGLGPAPSACVRASERKLGSRLCDRGGGGGGGIQARTVVPPGSRRSPRLADQRARRVLLDGFAGRIPRRDPVKFLPCASGRPLLVR